MRDNENSDKGNYVERSVWYLDDREYGVIY